MTDESVDLSSLRPYLLRAHHEWMSDNGLTPHLVVNAQRPNVQVPQAFVKDGSIVLNVSLRAVRDLNLGNEHIAFSARFAGSPHQVFVPIEAVRGLVAREYGIGVTFPDSTDELNSDLELALNAVAEDYGDGDDEPSPRPPTGRAGPAPGKPASGRPSLRVVK
jgi:stringent starvation protein B